MLCVEPHVGCSTFNDRWVLWFVFEFCLQVPSWYRLEFVDDIQSTLHGIDHSFGVRVKVDGGCSPILYHWVAIHINLVLSVLLPADTIDLPHEHMDFTKSSYFARGFGNCCTSKGRYTTVFLLYLFGVMTVINQQLNFLFKKKFSLIYTSSKGIEWVKRTLF